MLRSALIQSALTLLAWLFGVVLVLPGALAATVDVFPGVGTLQAAIDAVAEGTKIRMHPGTYTGAVTVNKRAVKLVSYPDVPLGGGVTIDGDCAAGVALDIAADGVRVQAGKLHNFPGVISVVRGTTTQIRIASHSNVVLQGRGPGTIMVDPPTQPLCGTEQDGVEVSGNSFKVKLVGVATSENPGAGFHLSGLPLNASVTLESKGSSGTSTVANAVGVLIENSANGSVVGKSRIKLKGMGIFNNTVAGIRALNSDGIAILDNNLGESSSIAGAVGIDLNASSDSNLVDGNEWADYGANTAFVDNGTDNCGSGNNFAVPPCP
jgi:hypothetical protein